MEGPICGKIKIFCSSKRFIVATTLVTWNCVVVANHSLPTKTITQKHIFFEGRYRRWKVFVGFRGLNLEVIRAY